MLSNNPPAFRVVIPARYSSSRLPGKPLVDLAGLPMIVRVYQRVTTAFPSTEIIVATDDNRIEETLKDYSIPYALTLSSHDTGSDRIAEIARKRNWGPNDIILNVQGDEPLVPVDLLRAFAEFCLTRECMDMASISVPFDNLNQLSDPNIVKLVVDSNGDALFFSRSTIPYCRDVQPTEWPKREFARHIGIYAYRNSCLQQITAAPACNLEQLEKLEQLRPLWLGMKISIMPWKISPPHGVDTPADVLRIVDLILKEKL